eukprot:Pgem_evm1s5749
MPESSSSKRMKASKTPVLIDTVNVDEAGFDFHHSRDHSPVKIKKVEVDFHLVVEKIICVLFDFVQVNEKDNTYVIFSDLILALKDLIGRALYARFHFLTNQLYYDEMTDFYFPKQPRFDINHFPLPDLIHSFISEIGPFDAKFCVYVPTVNKAILHSGGLAQTPYLHLCGRLGVWFKRMNLPCKPMSDLYM